MSDRRDAAAAALRGLKISPSSSLHTAILDALAAEGLIEPANGGLRASASTRIEKIDAAIQAAEDDPHVKGPALTFALGSLRSHAISLDDLVNDRGNIDISRLDSVMASKQLSPGRKITIKTALARAGLVQ